MSLLAYLVICWIAGKTAGCSVDSSKWHGSVYEYAAIGSEVLLYNETDQLVVFGENDTLTLMGILESVFNVTDENKIIVANASINRMLHLSASILCEGADMKNKTVGTNITVLNINSINDVVFHNLPKTISVNETTAEKTVIYTVQATDDDVDDLQYMLAEDSNFTIDSVSGDVSIVNQLDYRASPQHFMEITVTSFGFSSSGSTYNQSKISNLTVKVINNDLNPPKFLFNNCKAEDNDCGVYKARVETGKIQVLDITPNNITAQDVDPNNASVTYKLAWGDPENSTLHLKINETDGIVTVVDPIPDPVEYYINVLATESTGKSSTASLYVQAYLPQTKEAKTYPYYVVNGLIGGLVTCFVVAIVLIWYLVWRVRQQPAKKIDHPVHHAKPNEVHYVASPPLPNAPTQEVASIISADANPGNQSREKSQPPQTQQTVTTAKKFNPPAARPPPSFKPTNYQNTHAPSAMNRGFNEAEEYDDILAESAYEMEPQPDEGAYEEGIPSKQQTDTYEEPAYQN